MMGAHNFHCTGTGKDARTAYADAVTGALYECGHDPYNGTISTTSGFKVIEKPPRVRFDKWFRETEEKVLDGHYPGIEKWEACAAIRDPKSKRVWHFIGWAAS